MPHKAAFMGFQHAHMYELYQILSTRADIQIAAVCEEDSGVRQGLVKRGIPVSHSSYEMMLAEAEFDILIVGDVFGKRGAVTLRALQAGKHVLSDKPVCTQLEELAAIRDAVSGGRCLGCMFTLRDSGVFRKLKELLDREILGTLYSIGFAGQHPLNLGTRPDWYFDREQHGGTLNDLFVHAADFLPWVSGLKLRRIVAAREWCSGRIPSFKDGAQIMIGLGETCSVIGDVSYVTPDSFAYTLPQYWRFVLWGSEGCLEAGYNLAELHFYPQGKTEAIALLPLPDQKGGYLDSFLREIEGVTRPEDLNSVQVLEATRIGLTAQSASNQPVYVDL